MPNRSTGKPSAKFKTYFSKWKPIRQALPGVATELELLGMERGPKFDKVVEDFFQLQLLGRARKPEDHAKILRKLAGIKELPKKVEEKKKPEKPKKKGEAAPEAGNRRGGWAGDSRKNTASPHGARKIGLQANTEAESQTEEKIRGRTAAGEREMSFWFSRLRCKIGVMAPEN